MGRGSASMDYAEAVTIASTGQMRRAALRRRRRPSDRPGRPKLVRVEHILVPANPGRRVAQVVHLDKSWRDHWQEIREYEQVDEVATEVRDRTLVGGYLAESPQALDFLIDHCLLSPEELADLDDSDKEPE